MEKTQLNVKGIPAELIARAQKQAEMQDRSLSQVIRDLLKAWTKREEAKAAKSGLPMSH